MEAAVVVLKWNQTAAVLLEIRMQGVLGGLFWFRILACS